MEDLLVHEGEAIRGGPPMHALTILQRCVAPLLAGVHRRRLAGLPRDNGPGSPGRSGLTRSLLHGAHHRLDLAELIAQPRDETGRQLTDAIQFGALPVFAEFGRRCTRLLDGAT